MSKAKENWIDLAWAGWRTRVPPEFRPLQIEGTNRRGQMLLGDGSRARMQFKWVRPRRRRFDPHKWVRSRMRRHSTSRDQGEVADSSGGFDATGWVLKTKGDTHLAVWCGGASAGRLALEVTLQLPEGDGRALAAAKTVVQSLAVSPAEEPTRWAIFATSFISPPGFEYVTGRFNLGDVALQFQGGSQRLVLQQVFPASLALSRRKLDKWLISIPFVGRWKSVELGDAQPYRVNCQGSTFEGVSRTWIRRLPLPIGFLSTARRAAISAAVVNEDLGRLLLIDHDRPEYADVYPIDELISTMNQAGQDDGDVR